MIESLLGESCSSAHSYCHHWEAGDFVVWDNRLAMHAHNDMTLEDGPRVMHVVALEGSPQCNGDLQACRGVAQARARARARFGRAAQ